MLRKCLRVGELVFLSIKNNNLSDFIQFALLRIVILVLIAITPILNGDLIDKIVLKKNMFLVFESGAKLLVLMIVGMIVGYLRLNIQNKCEIFVTLDLNRRLLEKLEAIQNKFHQTKDAAYWVTRIRTDCVEISNFFF